MTIKDTISSYLHKGKAAETESAAAQPTTPASNDTSAATSTSPVKPHEGSEPVPSTAEDALKRLQEKDDEKATLSPSSAVAAEKDVSHTATTTSTSTPGSASLSRNPSHASTSGIDKYKTVLMNKLPVGQFDIGMLLGERRTHMRNDRLIWTVQRTQRLYRSTLVSIRVRDFSPIDWNLTDSPNTVGPLYYDTVRPGESERNIACPKHS